MKYISNIIQIWYSEFHAVTHDVGLILFCFLVPLFYPLLYTFIYTNETVREVPMAVVDECHSQESREFCRKVDATAEAEILFYTDMAQAEELMKREKVYGIMRIPASFSRNLARGEQTNVALYSDMRCMLYYKSMLVAASMVSLDMNRNIKVSRYLRGSTDAQEAVLGTPVTNSYVPFYNPQSGFASFLIPAVLMMIIQQLLFLTIGSSMGKFREENRGCAIPAHNFRYRWPSCIVLGKTFFYFPAFLLIAIYMYAVITPGFSLISLGSYVTFLTFVTPYILSCIFLGITLSTFIHRAEDSMLLFVFSTLPLLFISGISWPVAALPDVWRYFSYLVPSTFGMHGYERIMSMGAHLNEVAFEFKGLWIQCAVYFVTAYWVYFREYKKFGRIN